MTTILVTGRTGQVGHELTSALAPLGRVVAVGRDQCDLTQADSIIRCIRDIAPDIIVNTAAFTAVDDAEAEPVAAMQINGEAPGIMAEEARRRNLLLLHYSTDYVFDGSKAGVYSEDDAANPVNTYGKTKLAGERNIIASGCRHLILRTSWTYGGRGTNFLLTMLRLAREQRSVPVVTDQTGSPTWARALAAATAEVLLAQDRSPDTLGIYHLSAEGHVPRCEFAETIIALAREASGIAEGWAGITPTTTADYPRPAARPLNAATSKDKIRRSLGIVMPHWKQQLRACLFSLDWSALRNRQG